MLAACLEREDPRDVFISHKAKLARRAAARRDPRHRLAAPAGDRQARCGRTCKWSPLRGNVETRLRKLDDGEVDATILALAGLKRLGLVQHATAIMSVG